MSEKRFMASVIKAAKLCGWAVYHTHDSRRSAFGFPDLVLVRGGDLIFLELKRDGESPTPEQQDWLLALGLVRRVRAGVARPSDWDWVRQVLTGEREDA